jgi:hypothetical protein
MRRALIIAVGFISLAAPSRAGDFFEGPKVEIHLGFWNYEAPLFGNGNGNSGQYQPRRQYVVSPTESFTGAYYVESGHCYFQPQAGQRQRIEAGSFARVDDLATRLEYEASLACIDMNDNYHHNPGYAKTYKAAFQLYELAHDLDASAQQSDHSAVAENLEKLGPLLDSVRKDTNGWSRHQHEQHGEGGLQTKLDRLASLNHHLSIDVEPSTPTSQTASAGSPDRSLLRK